MAQRLNVFVTEKYTSNGDEKTKYHQVGTMFAHDKGEGFNLEIVDGVSVSGRLVAFPPKERDASE